MIHSVDSIHLMDEIDKQAKKHGLVMDILIEVNISGETSKSGIAPEELDALLSHAGSLTGIRVRGLMTVAPKIDRNITNTLHFDNMHRLFLDTKKKKYDNVSMDYLSMGMSGDFEDAIRSGATMVRVGTAIFGALMSLVGFAGTATINAAQSQMLIAIYIIGNIIAWGGIGVLLIFYKLDKIYPRIITEMKKREAAEAAKASANA